MAPDLLFLILGIALLTFGGEVFVRGALAAARRLRVSPIAAGLVIVGFGTSAPELVVSIDAAVGQQPEIALGNVVGSNIGNILLILGVCALIAPLSISKRALTRDALSMVGATIMFLVLAFGAGLTRIDGVLFLLSLAVYLVWTYRSEVQQGGPASVVHRAEADEFHMLPTKTWLILVSLAGGLVTLIVGSRFTLTGALGLGDALGAPQAVIGVSVVAVGTSLPEFAVSVLATLRGHHDVAIGNILGSNLFNVFGILGVSAILQPLPVTGRMASVDQWVMLSSALLLTVLLMSGRRLNRFEGGLLVGCYVAYTGLMYLGPTI